MDMSEVGKFDRWDMNAGGVKGVRDGPSLLRWFAAELRKPGLRQCVGEFYRPDLHAACAIGKVWTQNLDSFNSIYDMEEFFARVVGPMKQNSLWREVMHWNDLEVVSFTTIAQRLERMAATFDAWRSPGGTLHEIQRVWLATARAEEEEGTTTVEVTA